MASAFLLAGAATAAASLHDAGTTQAQPGSRSTAASTSSTRALSFGVDYSDTLPWENDAQLAASLDDAVDVGAHWIRVDLAWEDYQSTSAAFAPDFSRFDRVVRAANARGLHVLATLDFPPVWARESSCAALPDCPPAEDSQFAQFAREAAERYAPMGVHTWEVWNEPNIPTWVPKPDPAAYAALLSATARALHAADASAFVLLGGLAAQQPHPGIAYIAAADFITQVAAHGGLSGVDAVSYHPYPNQQPVAASSTIEAIDAIPDNLVAALARAGAGDLPIWVTETGTSVPESGKSRPDSATLARQQQAQAQAAEQLVQAFSAIPAVSAVFWFSDQDTPSQNLFYGLRTAEGTRRPVFTALQQAIAAHEKGKD